LGGRREQAQAGERRDRSGDDASGCGVSAAAAHGEKTASPSGSRALFWADASLSALREAS